MTYSTRFQQPGQRWNPYPIDLGLNPQQLSVMRRFLWRDRHTGRWVRQRQQTIATAEGAHTEALQLWRMELLQHVPPDRFVLARGAEVRLGIRSE